MEKDLNNNMVYQNSREILSKDGRYSPLENLRYEGAQYEKLGDLISVDKSKEEKTKNNINPNIEINDEKVSKFSPNSFSQGLTPVMNNTRFDKGKSLVHIKSE